GRHPVGTRHAPDRFGSGLSHEPGRRRVEHPRRPGGYAQPAVRRRREGGRQRPRGLRSRRGTGGDGPTDPREEPAMIRVYPAARRALAKDVPKVAKGLFAAFVALFVLAVSSGASAVSILPVEMIASGMRATGYT